MSKLYTKKQVIDMLNEHAEFNVYYPNVSSILENYTPIELPTDEEVENNAYSDKQVDYWEHEQQIGFERGAKWMRDKIKGGQDE